MKRVCVFVLQFVLGFFLVLGASAFAAPPVVFFSDLTSGPDTGWEGSATKGAAVTIWGKGFGSVRGSSYVTVNGASLVNASDYAEWGLTGTSNGIARGLERITFWLNSTCTNGAGTITVTVSGLTSAPIPFTVRAGNIYFISIADGNDSFNGTRSTNQGSNNGPWRNAPKISPSNNSVLRPGDCIYIKGGTYTQLDDQQMFVHMRPNTNLAGTATNPYAVAAYPGETPTFNCSAANRGFNYPEGARPDYWTYSKLKFLNGWGAYSAEGIGVRVIGSWFQDMTNDLWSGVVWVSNSNNTYIYGNYWDNCGHDKYKHNIYAKSQTAGTLPVTNLYIGWNEFSRPVSSDGYGGTVFLSKSSDFGSGNTTQIYIFSNYFHGGNSGEHIYTGDNTSLIDQVYIYDNLFVGGTTTNHGCIYWSPGTGSGYIYNNTFYLVTPGFPVINYGTASGTLQCKNNIFYNAAGQGFFATTSGNGLVVTSDHDLFYQSGSTTLPSGVGQLTVTNPITGNPLLVSSTDFHLQSGSPAVNAGANVSSVLTSDFDGVSRGATPDIGAYEVASSGSQDTTPPANPTGLRIGP